MLPLVALALLGAAAGGGVQAARGKRGSDLLKGAGLGALTGLTGGALGGAMGAGGAGAAGAGASSAAASTAGAAKGLGLAELLKQSAIQTGMGVGAQALTPQTTMTQFGSVPQMQQEDPMVALQQLMAQSRNRRTI